MISQTDISIILVNYNSGMLLYNCIRSVVNYTKNISYEIIIVDNNSEDDSLDKVEEEFMNKITVIKNKRNEGFGAANNQGLKVASGKYVLFLNNDTIFIENTLKVLLGYLIAESNKKMLIASQLLNEDKTVQHSVYSFQTLWLSFTTYFFLYAAFPKSKYFNRYYLMNIGIKEITEVETVTGAFMMFRKEDIEELNGFDEDYFFYGEDNDLCKRFRNIGGKIVYYPFTKVMHIKGATKKTNWFHIKHHTLSIINLFSKHYSYPEKMIARILFFIGILMRSLIHFVTFLFTFNNDHLEESKLKFKALAIIVKGKD